MLSSILTKLSLRLQSTKSTIVSLQAKRKLANPTNKENFAAKMSSAPTQTITYVTIRNEEEALELARALVENRMAACVNIVKEVKSVYEWKGKIEEESESMLIIKSDTRKSADLVQFVENKHQYKCPEILTVKIDSGNKDYLEWISGTLSKRPVDPLDR